MATLTSLKLVAAKKPAQKDPVQHRRAKLSAKVVEQLHYARALNAGEVYAPTRIKTVTNAEGERVQVNQPKRIKPWWFQNSDGKLCVSIRYGAKVLELKRGMPSIQVADLDGLLEDLAIIKTEVEKGSFDEEIELASGALKANFKTK